MSVVALLTTVAPYVLPLIAFWIGHKHIVLPNPSTPVPNMPPPQVPQPSGDPVLDALVAQLTKMLAGHPLAQEAITLIVAYWKTAKDSPVVAAK